MKNLILSILLLTSCTTQEEPPVIEESTEIVGGYVDTLENSIIDAKNVMEEVNERNEEKMPNYN